MHLVGYAVLLARGQLMIKTVCQPVNEPSSATSLANESADKLAYLNESVNYLYK
jgi:hypothetical protein